MSYPPVADLVPQRPPMLLLAEVLAADARAITCAAEVQGDDLLVREGRAPAAAAIEYMAQTIAAHAGLRARAAGRPVARGVVVACRDLVLRVEHLDVGDRLEITAELAFEGPLADYRARVTRGGDEIAAAQIHVATEESTA